MRCSEQGLTGGDIEEDCRRAVLQAARCALHQDGGEVSKVTVPEGDLLKILDRWRLTSSHRIGYEGST